MSPKKLSTCKTLRRERDAAMLAEGCLAIDVVANALGVSDKRAYALANNGHLARRMYGGTVYVEKKSLEAYQASLMPPKGWILVAEAVKRYHFGRSALLARAKRGEIGRKVYSHRTHLCVADLEVMVAPARK
jgi:hypothetical protein